MNRFVAAMCILFILSPTAALAQANPNANWRALVQEAYSKSDLVVRGTVQSVRDDTERDGGHVYTLRVTGQHKGPAQQSVSLRAGGYFYLVPLAVNESVLMFLKSSGRGPAAERGPDYSVVEADSMTPMVFRVEQGRASPVDRRLQSDFSGVSADQVEDLLRSMKP
jgi:hypothetical protein